MWRSDCKKVYYIHTFCINSSFIQCLYFSTGSNAFYFYTRSFCGGCIDFQSIAGNLFPEHFWLSFWVIKLQPVVCCRLLCFSKGKLNINLLIRYLQCQLREVRSESHLLLSSTLRRRHYTSGGPGSHLPKDSNEAYAFWGKFFIIWESSGNYLIFPLENFLIPPFWDFPISPLGNSSFPKLIFNNKKQTYRMWLFM